MKLAEHPLSPSANRQLLASITSHPSFQTISSALAVVEQSQGELATADLPVVQLQIMQMRGNREGGQARKQKMEQAVAKLQEMVNYVEECGKLMEDKLKWTALQCEQVLEQRDEVEEEIDILSGQGKRRIAKDCVSNLGGGDELRDLLSFYHCRKNFPKNKTEALMLLNQIQSKIQQLQMKRAASFTFDIQQE